jgi:fumarate hydratase subunit beta
MQKRITLPLTDEIIKDLKAGDNILLNGTIYVGRDAAHKRMIEALDKGQELPFDIRGQTIYYMGPSPAKPGQAIGSAGPTTSGRMDPYSLRLLAEGLKGMIGKGNRSPAVKDAMKKHQAVYLAAIGGAGALIARSIKKAEVIAYEELGAEAIRRLELEDFPAMVANDIYGGDIYQDSRAEYRVDRS